MILCLGTTPAAQRVMVFRKLVLDAVNRAITAVDGAAGKSINVAKVLKTLGEQPVAIGFLGGDRGEEISRLLEARGIELDCVAVDARTRQCITVIDESAGAQTELVEESLPVPAEKLEALMEIVRRRVKGARAVVMSGTIAPGGSEDLYRRCAQLAHEGGAIAIVDARGAALAEALAARPELVKPNRLELAATLGRELADERATLCAMQELRERGAQQIVVTAGKEPTLAADDRHCWRIRGPRIKAVNPIGSGDSFTAGLVWRLLRGDDLGEACRWASAAGAANALTLMAGQVEIADMEKLAAQTTVEAIQ